MKKKNIRENIDNKSISSKSKKAITLVTLLVTIIVILILTGAIILTIRKSSSINSANETVLRSDLQSIKESYREKYNDLLFDYNGKKENIPIEELEDVVPDEYRPDFIILPEGPAYVGDDPETEEIAEEMGYIIGYPKDKVEFEFVNLETVEDKITVNFGLKETDLEIIKIKYYISQDGINWVDVESDEYTHEFTGLEEFTEYQIKIVVTDENGEDTESDIYSIKTKMRNFEAGTLKMTEDTADGEEYTSGEWTNHSVYIKVNDDIDPTVKTTYEAEGSNEIPKGTTENTIMENSGISKIIVTTEKYGTTRTREYEVKIDKEKPVINSLASNNTDPTNKNVVITGNAVDTLSGIVGYQFSKDGNLDINSDGWTDITATNKNINVTEEIKENGVYYFYVKDAAGNVSKEEIIIDYIDKTAPTLDSMEVITPDNGTYKEGQEITIVATFSKNIKGYPPTLKVRFGDGEERSITTGKISGKTITYTYTIQNGDNGVLVSTGYNGSVTDSVGNNLNVENMPLGGNIIIADTTPPTKTAPTLNSNTNSIVATFKQTDSLSGINNSTIQYAIKEEDSSKWGEWITVGAGSYTFTNLIKNTTYQVKTRVSDNAGNTTESNVSTISTIDITKPTLSAPPDYSSGPVIVTIIYPEIPDTIKQYSTDGINWTEATDVVQTVPVDTNYTTVYARVIDNTDQTSGNATYTVTCIDKNLPTVEIGTNGGNYTMNIGTSEITISTPLSARDTGGSGLDLMQYQLSTSETLPLDSDINWKDFTNGDTITETVTGGIYYIYTKVTDKAGNRAEVIQKSNPYIIQYQISYDANGGSGIPDEQLKVHGTDLTISSMQPTKSGFVFAGWSKDKSATVGDYRAGAKYTVNEPAMLYAIWSLNVYSVKYDANGGTLAPDEQQKAHDVSLILTTQKPQKEGYDFVGWNTDSTATTAQYEAGGTYNDNEDITLYAVWRLKTYVIKYDANGGSSAPSDQTKTHGIDLQLRETQASRIGYSFLGWSTDKSATTAQYNPGDMFSINASTILYAVWSINAFTVKYDLNGGTGVTIEDQYKYYGQGLTLTDKKPIREGYNFLGWSQNEHATVADYESGATYSTDASATLYAVWQMITFTVSYDYDDGRGIVGTQTKYYWEDLTLWDGPERNYYNFIGWNTDKNATTALYGSGGTYTKNENVTLYPIWDPKSYKITLDVNGGDPLNPSVIDMKFGDNIGKLPIPTKDNYKFFGWGPDPNDTRYYLPEAILEPNDVTLYAIWGEGATISITSNPEDTQVYIGDQFGFSFGVRYRGDITYQWYINDTRTNTGGTLIPGANTNTYKDIATNDNDGKFFYCVVTVVYDGETVTKTTDAAMLTVIRPKAEIIEQPKDFQTYIGSDFGFDFSLHYVAETLSYQWYMNTTNSNTGGTLIPGATSKLYNGTGTNDINGKYFYCVITATINNYTTTATTQPAKLTVVGPRVTITKNPENQSQYVTDKAGFVVNATGAVTENTGLTCQWYWNTTNSNTGGTLIPGATSALYEVDAISENDGRYYYCVVTSNVNGYTATAASTAAKLTVLGPRVTIVEQPKDCLIVKDSKNGFTVALGVYPQASVISAQWYINDIRSNEGGTLDPNGTGLECKGDFIDGKYYYCAITASLGGYTTTVKTEAAKVTIVPDLQIRITSDPSDCTTVVGDDYNFGIGVEGTKELSFQWYMNATNSNTGGTPIPGATSYGCTGIATADMNGKYVYCVATTTVSGKSKSVTSGTAQLFVKDAYYSVTKAGKTYYADTLQLAESYAVSGASDTEGGTITVLKNVPSDYAAAISKSVRLNTNGKTVNIPQIQLNTNDITFKIDGGGSLVSPTGGLLYNDARANLDVKNVSLSTTNSGGSIVDNMGAGNVSLTNVTANAAAGTRVLHNEGTGTINYNSGSITSTRAAIENAGSGTVNIYGGAITGANIALNTGSGVVNVTAGTFSTSLGNVLGNMSNGKIIVNGNVSLSTTSDAAVVTNSGSSGGTVELTSATINMRSDGAALINTGTFKMNNVNVTSNSNSYAQLSGTSNITNTNMTSSTADVINCKGGNITLNSGRYIATGQIVTIGVNSGTVNILGGTYESDNGNAILIDGSGNVAMSGGTINAGKNVSSTIKVPAVVNSGKFTMSGGTINAKGSGIDNKSGTSTITGGTVTCTEDSAIDIEGGSVIVGSPSVAISTTNPVFSGTYGVNNKSGTLYFYNGILRGTTSPYTGSINKRGGATLTTGTSGSYKTAYYI